MAVTAIDGLAHIGLAAGDEDPNIGRKLHLHSHRPMTVKRALSVPGVCAIADLQLPSLESDHGTDSRLCRRSSTELRRNLSKAVAGL